MLAHGICEVFLFLLFKMSQYLEEESRGPVISRKNGEYLSVKQHWEYNHAGGDLQTYSLLCTLSAKSHIKDDEYSNKSFFFSNILYSCLR